MAEDRDLQDDREQVVPDAGEDMVGRTEDDAFEDVDELEDEQEEDLDEQ